MTRGVVYDLPHSLRPRPVPGSIFVRGTTAWRRYLDAREAVDVGEPAVLIAFRVMDDEERYLVVDWGTTYANTFLLIEPRDWRCDLSDPLNPFTRRLDEALALTLAAAPEGGVLPEGWTRASPLGRLLRELFGTWRYWTASSPASATRRISLELREDSDTIWSRLLPELSERFPQAAFDRALGRLHGSDRELFGGPVPRARSVFRTRLGLPVLHDVRCVDRAVRRLVNEGAMRVVSPTAPGRPIFGPGRPIPDGISDDEFAQFVMI